MKNSTSPARAFAALISGWSSCEGALDRGVGEFIGRQNSNEPRRCHERATRSSTRSVSEELVQILRRSLAYASGLCILGHISELVHGWQAMVFVLGTDEAGYGPNLGPLCIAASAWEQPDGAA